MMYMCGSAVYTFITAEVPEFEDFVREEAVKLKETQEGIVNAVQLRRAGPLGLLRSMLRNMLRSKICSSLYEGSIS
jgi:hypothetical protein